MIEIKDAPKETIKSVFLQKQYVKLYEVTCNRHGYMGPHEKCISMRDAKDTPYTIVKIAEYDLDIPMLEQGETFYLCDLNKRVVITERMRDTNGSITYFIEPEYIETEETRKSKEEAEQLLITADARYETLAKEHAILHNEFEDYKRIYKYKHRFNF